MVVPGLQDRDEDIDGWTRCSWKDHNTVLKNVEVVITIPTIGFNVETMEYKNLYFTVWDVGGQDKIQPLWYHFCPGTNGLIYVANSNDRDRIEDAKEGLDNAERGRDARCGSAGFCR